MARAARRPRGGGRRRARKPLSPARKAEKYATESAMRCMRTQKLLVCVLMHMRRCEKQPTDLIMEFVGA